MVQTFRIIIRMALDAHHVKNSSRYSTEPGPHSLNSKGEQIGVLHPHLDLAVLVATSQTLARDGVNNRQGKTFSLEVLLLRRPSDSTVRGRAKAELQRIGHAMSSFDFDKARHGQLTKYSSNYKRHLRSLCAIRSK